MTDFQIIKRNGSPENYSPKKLNHIIEIATAGFDLPKEDLINDIESILKENIKSSEILGHLTLSAVKRTDVLNPDWKNVAGRLKIIELIKNTSLKRGINLKESSIYQNYLQYVKNAVQEKVYTDVLLEKYSEAELIEAGKFINPDYDFVYDFAGASLLIKRYLCEHKDYIFELPQEMFLTISLLVEQNEDKSVRMAQVKDTYEKLANRKISLGTPFLMNLRRPNGNLSSCFITAMDDSRESIFYVIDQISAISKFGGGVGCNVSRVRCKGARIRGIKNSSGGVVPWIRIINDTAVAVNQQGKRKGAVTVSLDVWHMDIEDFLELRTENGDQRMKAYDIFPQVIIPDLFMKKVEKNEDWLLVDPNEIRSKYKVEIADLWGEKFTKFYNELYMEARAGKLEMFKFISAKELIKRVMKTQIETGMPYIAFKDTLNKYNPNKHDGAILGTNLCTESHSNVKPTKFADRRLEGGKIVAESFEGLVHVCNLVSINLSTITTDKELDSVCQTSVRILDNAIDFTEVPILEGLQHNRRYRTIGIGAMGLADKLALNNIPYTNSADYVDDLFEKMAIYNIRASINIAKKKGTFEAYKGSEWDKRIILNKDRTEMTAHSKYAQEWNEIYDNLAKYGIRNSQLAAIAPNTSSSLIQGCTASVLPVYSKFFVETHGKGSVPNCPPFIKDKFWFYQENRNINQTVVVDIMSRINKWIDTGISVELIYNLNRNIRAQDIYNTILDAWKKDIKTLYYTRTIQKDGSSSEKEECISCAS
ncbi:MAG: ribonucleoside-diphosphate reductase subunit alpha [Alphaproteobacteria bacterium]|nr:ribonucleoside-diphosphate reductase subunit alpha [Alphaproteobacteria bacterium]